MKELLGVIAVIMTFIAYIPYYRDILKGKTHPHIYSWSLWLLLTALIVALQIKGGAGPATFVTIAAGLMCLGVIVLGLKYGKKDITTLDTYVLFLALIAIGFWVFAKQPLVALFLGVVADILAFIPTIRKSWNKPQTETLSLYITNGIRFTIALLAVREYTLLSTLWIVVWAVGNYSFALMLVLRRKQIG